MTARQYIPWKADTDMAEWLAEFAARHGISRSEAIRQIVRAAMVVPNRLSICGARGTMRGVTYVCTERLNHKGHHMGTVGSQIYAWPLR